MAAGEGLETMLSLRCVLPALPMVAALSATHLTALVLPPGLQRLYVARDNDRAGHRAAEMLGTRAKADGIEVLVLTPHADDFNTDLVALGPDALARLCVCSLRLRTSDALSRLEPASGPFVPRRGGRASGPPSPAAAPGLQMWRSGQKRLRPATAARGFLPLAARERRRHSSRDKKAVLAVLRSRSGPAGEMPLGAGLGRFRLAIA